MKNCTKQKFLKDNKFNFISFKIKKNPLFFILLLYLGATTFITTLVSSVSDVNVVCFKICRDIFPQSTYKKKEIKRKSTTQSILNVLKV